MLVVLIMLEGTLKCPEPMGDGGCEPAFIAGPGCDVAAEAVQRFVDGVRDGRGRAEGERAAAVERRRIYVAGEGAEGSGQASTGAKRRRKC